MKNEPNIVRLIFFEREYVNHFVMVLKGDYLSLQNCKHYFSILYNF